MLKFCAESLFRYCHREIKEVRNLHMVVLCYAGYKSYALSKRKGREHEPPSFSIGLPNPTPLFYSAFGARFFDPIRDLLGLISSVLICG